MPIKGLSDVRRIRRGGYIRLGEMVESAKKTGVMYPRAIDHFKPEFENKEHENLFHELYGDKPTRIRVAFGHDDPDTVFPQWFKLYGKSGLKCKGDNETANRWQDGEMVEVECIGPEECPYSLEHGNHGKPGCKRLASLQFFIHGVPELAVFQINTTSYHSIVNVNTGIELLRRLTGGKLAGIWVELILKPQEVQAEGKAKTVHVLDIVIPVGLHNVNQLESAFSAPLALPEPSDRHDPYLSPANGFAPEGEPVRPVPEAPRTVKAEPVDDVPTQAPPARQARKATPAPAADLASDPDVSRAFEEAGIGDVKRQAMLSSARSGGWGKDQLLTVIFKASGKGGGNGNGGAKPAPAKQPAAPAPPAPKAGHWGKPPASTHRAPQTAAAAPAGNDPADRYDF